MDQSQKLTKKERKEQRRLEYQQELQKEQRKKLFQKIGIWFGVIAVIVLSVAGLIKFANSPSSSVLSSEISNAAKISDKDIVKGNKNSKITLIEYSDFQCPACKYYQPIIKQVLSDFDGKILFAYRNFPLNTHKNAKPAAQAAYSAHLQGKFWEMHDMIFENQESWADSNDADKIFRSFAEKLKLNTDKFKADYNAKPTKSFIEDQTNEGISIGINSTPTFFLNYKQIKAQSYEEFKTLIQNELK